MLQNPRCKKFCAPLTDTVFSARLQGRIFRNVGIDFDNLFFLVLMLTPFSFDPRWERRGFTLRARRCTTRGFCTADLVVYITVYSPGCQRPGACCNASPCPWPS